MKRYQMITITALAALMLLAAAGPGRAADDQDRISPRLARDMASPGKTGAPRAVWVFFTDKGLDAAELPAALASARGELSPAALARRAKGAGGASLVDEADLPLASGYLAAVEATGAVSRRQSRWLNAASFEATDAQIAAIADLPFVARLDLVASTSVERTPPTASPPPGFEPFDAATTADKSLNEYEYGASLTQLEQINVTDAHTAGLTGKGVTVAILDTGFDLDHEALRDIDVVAAWDFVQEDDDVGDDPAEDFYQTVYGTGHLSAVAGYGPSNLIGAAFGASFILAKTEDLADETTAEEDNWIAAVEWAEGLGADIVSSGIGYYYWYDFADLDGMTAPITVAAELASARGVVIVTSAGNERANPGWPHIIAPADGRSVIAVGACDGNGLVGSTSSPGPTADGRIKPDVLALGVSTAIAYPYGEDIYYYGEGSNYAVPLVSGVVAMMLENDPGLRPQDVAEALRLTAGRADSPDNDYGWGVVDAMEALRYWGPRIEHEPLTDSEDLGFQITIPATIISDEDLDLSRTWLAWREQGGNWRIENFWPDSGDDYIARIPTRYVETTIEYYITAADATGRANLDPPMAPAILHSFHLGPDSTPPVITHVTMPDQAVSTWPPVVRCRAEDGSGIHNINLTFLVNEAVSFGPYDMTLVDDQYELELPLPAESVQPGLEISYWIMGTDNSYAKNIGFSGLHRFEIVENRGRVLLVDDTSLTKNAPAPEKAPLPTTDGTDKSAENLVLMLEDLGFAVDVLSSDQASINAFLGYDVVVSSSASNYAPMGNIELRSALKTWVELGGRLLVEGGEIAYVTYENPRYPELLDVLGIESYGGDDGGDMRVSASYVDHPFALRPNELEREFAVDTSGGYDWPAADIVVAAEGSFVPLQTHYGSRRGGVVAVDDNTCPDGGQKVYLAFDLMKADLGAATELLDNAMTYLTLSEPPGASSINGRVSLVGRTDNGGVTVRVGSRFETTTAADGSYSLDGLWGGTYTLIAEADGFAPAAHTLTITDDAVATAESHYLYPVTEVSYGSAPIAPIPDNDPAGVTATIDVSTTGPLFGVSVDVDIRHHSIGQLTVTLTSPGGTVVGLHAGTGGTADDIVGNWPGSLVVGGPGSLTDYVGEESSGTWTLTVVDGGFGATGTLNTWGLNLLVGGQELAAAGDGGGDAPALTRLVGNSPNPFNPQTAIAFDLAAAGPVRLEVFDLRGRLVRGLVDAEMPAGTHAVVWNGRDDTGGETASGIYLYRLRAEGRSDVRKMTLLR